MPSYYVDFRIETDRDALRDRSFKMMAARMPGWLPAPGSPLTVAFEVNADLAAETRDISALVPKAIFRKFFATMLNVVPLDPTKSRGRTTWTMIDDAGYTVKAGTVVSIRGSGGVVRYFQVVSDVTVPQGDTATAEGAVTIEAVEAGEIYDDLPGPVALVDALDYVADVVLESPTAGGSDGESDDEYLDRAAEEATLLRRTPVLPEQFAQMARKVPGVYRAVAIDNYDAQANVYGQERMVTVAVVDELGEPVSSATRTAVKETLEAAREVNFIVHVIDPQYTDIAVAFDVVCHPWAVASEVRLDVINAIQGYINPAGWGSNVGFEYTPREWANRPTVRYLEVAQVVNTVDGVDYIEGLTLNGVERNVSLTGPAPLPRATSVDGNVEQGS